MIEKALKVEGRNIHKNSFKFENKEYEYHIQEPTFDEFIFPNLSI